MYRFFTMAVAIAVMPLSQRFSNRDLAEGNLFEKPTYIFPYKNTITTNFWEPEKKPTEAWSQN